MEVENSKNKSSWGGARPGAGRKEGGENEATKEKKAVEAEMKQRILKSVDSLLNSQMSVAHGIQMLYRIEKDEDGKQKKPELVTTQGEIEDYLAGEYADGTDYYFITTERPDTRAIDSLLDRTFGKAPQPLKVGGDEDNKTPIVFDSTFKNYGNSTQSTTGDSPEQGKV